MSVTLGKIVAIVSRKKEGIFFGEYMIKRKKMGWVKFEVRVVI